MEMVLKIANALKDGEISFEEVSELLKDLRNFDYKALKKLLNYLSIAALFVPQLRPYAACIHSLKNILNGGTVKLNDIIEALPKEVKSKIIEAVNLSKDTDRIHYVEITSLMNILSGLYRESMGKMSEKPLNPENVVSKDYSQELRDAKVKMALNTEKVVSQM